MAGLMLKVNGSAKVHSGLRIMRVFIEKRTLSNELQQFQAYFKPGPSDSGFTSIDILGAIPANVTDDDAQIKLIVEYSVGSREERYNKSSDEQTMDYYDLFAGIFCLLIDSLYFALLKFGYHLKNKDKLLLFFLFRALL